MISKALMRDGDAKRNVDGRVMHLVDVENLVGAADFAPDDAERTYRAYLKVAPAGAVNQLVLATSHHAAPSTWFVWPANARRLLRSGADGADLALLEVLERESIAARFDRVVIGSGDGIFSFAAARLQADGVDVTVVSRQEALSRRLAFAVRDVRVIDPPQPASAIEGIVGLA